MYDRFQSFITKFGPYLDDIRIRLYRLSIIFVIIFIFGFLLSKSVLKFILSFFDIENVTIATTSPFQFADLSINIGLFFSLIICLPLLVYNIFMFLRPAMTDRERMMFLFLIPLTIILFFCGFLYGFFILYYALILLAQINNFIGIQNIWDISMFLSQIISTAILLGILFQFPIVFTFVIRLGVVDVNFLKEKRRFSVLIIFIFTSLLPPTDGLSLIAMALPLILLYELTIYANSKFGKLEIIS
jgi:sec-independent protein translocase protein TatC